MPSTVSDAPRVTPKERLAVIFDELEELSMLVELPRRTTEMVLTGVPHQAKPSI